MVHRWTPALTIRHPGPEPGSRFFSAAPPGKAGPRIRSGATRWC